MSAASIAQLRRPVAFTLMELLVVVVILSILGMALVPALSNQANLRVEAAQRVFMSQIQFAQTHAIATNRWTVVMVGNDSVTVYERTSKTGPLIPVPHPTNPGDFVTRVGVNGPPPMKQVRIAAVNFSARPGLSFDESGVPHSVFADGSGTAPLIFSGSITVASGNDAGTVEVAPYSGEVTTR